MLSPARNDNCSTGKFFAFGPISITWPRSTNGVTNTLKRSAKAKYLPSGDTLYSVANLPW